MYGQYLNRLFLYDVDPGDFIPRVTKLLSEPVNRIEDIDKVLSITHENYYSLLCARVRKFPARPEVIMETLINIINQNSLMMTKHDREKQVMLIASNYLNSIVKNFTNAINKFNALKNDADAIREMLNKQRKLHENSTTKAPVEALRVNQAIHAKLEQTLNARTNGFDISKYLNRYFKKSHIDEPIRFVDGPYYHTNSRQVITELREKGKAIHKVTDSTFFFRHAEYQVLFLEEQIPILRDVFNHFCALLKGKTAKKWNLNNYRTQLAKHKCKILNNFYQTVLDPDFDLITRINQIEINEEMTPDQFCDELEAIFEFEALDHLLSVRREEVTSAVVNADDAIDIATTYEELTSKLAETIQLIRSNEDGKIVFDKDKLVRTGDPTIDQRLDELVGLVDDYQLNSTINTYKTLWLYLVTMMKELAFAFFCEEDWCNYGVAEDYSLLDEMKTEPPLFAYMLRRINTQFALTADAKLHGDMDKNSSYERKLSFECLGNDDKGPSYIWLNKRKKNSKNPLCHLRSVTGERSEIYAKNEQMKHFISNNVLLINGGTGTGKDTFIKVFIDYLLSVDCYYGTKDALTKGKATGSIDANEISILNIGEREGAPTYYWNGKTAKTITDVRLSTSINEVINFIIASSQKVIFINSLNTLMSEFNQQQLAKGAIDIGNFRAAMAALNDICNLTGKFVVIVNRLESSDNTYIENVKQMTEGLTGCSIFLQKKDEYKQNDSTFAMSSMDVNDHPFQIINRTSLSEGTSKYGDLHGISLTKMRYFLDVTATDANEKLFAMFKRTIAQEPMRRVINPNYDLNTLGGQDDDQIED